MSEQLPNGQNSIEHKEPENTLDIDTLPERLGFSETEELAQLRTKLVEAIATGDQEEISKLSLHYHLLGEEVVNRLEGDAFPKGQLGLNLAMALIRRDGGRLDAYIEDLRDALDQCYGLGYQDIAPTIVLEKMHAEGLLEKQQAPETNYDGPSSQEIADALQGAIENDDYEDVVGMEPEEAIGYAFTLLLEYGVENPEAYLKEKGILE